MTHLMSTVFECVKIHSTSQKWKSFLRCFETSLPALANPQGMISLGWLTSKNQTDPNATSVKQVSRKPINRARAYCAKVVIMSQCSRMFSQKLLQEAFA